MFRRVHISIINYSHPGIFCINNDFSLTSNHFRHNKLYTGRRIRIKVRLNVKKKKVRNEIVIL